MLGLYFYKLFIDWYVVIWISYVINLCIYGVIALISEFICIMIGLSDKRLIHKIDILAKLRY